MYNKAYIVTLEKGLLLDVFPDKNFHNQITTTEGVLNWWHYIDNVYLLIVNANITATSLSKYIMEIAPKRQFFVVEVDLTNHNGILPQEAWNWINNHNQLNNQAY